MTHHRRTLRSLGRTVKTGKSVATAAAVVGLVTSSWLFSHGPAVAATSSAALAARDPAFAGYRAEVDGIGTTSIETELRVPRVPRDERCAAGATAMRSVMDVVGVDDGRAAVEVTGRCTARGADGSSARAKITYALHVRPTDDPREEVAQPLRAGDLLVLRVLESDGITEVSITNADRGWTELFVGNDIRPVEVDLGVRTVGDLPLPAGARARFVNTWVNGERLTEVDARRTHCVRDGERLARAGRLDAAGDFAVRVTRS